MPDLLPPKYTREDFAALSADHAAFVDAGGYEAIHTLRRIAMTLNVPYVMGLEVSGGVHAFGYVPSGSSIEIQAAALAVHGRLEDLLSALAAELCVPVGQHGDGDIAPKSRQRRAGK